MYMLPYTGLAVMFYLIVGLAALAGGAAARFISRRKD